MSLHSTLNRPRSSTSLWTLGFLTLVVCVLAGSAFAGPPASVFTDGFEAGDFTGWHSNVDPNKPNCSCYFSGDCFAGESCNYGPGGFTTEDICNWRDTKPSGNPGTGCDLIHVGAWGGPICDGICQPSRLGSMLGHEDLGSLVEGVHLWGRAILDPAIAGGGPIDPDLAQQALALDFSYPDAAWELGRQVADLLVLTADIRMYDHFCHYEHGGGDDPAYWVDLSQNLCRAKAGRLTVEALSAAMLNPGSSSSILAELSESCSGWESVANLRCPSGSSTLDCVRNRVEDAAVFLSTPVGGAGQDSVPETSRTR
ncbi:MAG: hypothetical protein SX243_19235 [Acidobacteriota bacterium]|nr:hypothetical protein [Acidobacteriota bacterium]